MLEIRAILCPIDFSEFSIMAYRHALSLAAHYRAKLVAQHVVELWRHPSASLAPSASLYHEYCQSLCGRGMEQLQQFVKDHAHNEVQPNLVVVVGIAPDAILSFAQAEKSDVIVMGTHGLRGFDRLMLGSATERVMRRAPCPVLAVREPPHEYNRDNVPQFALSPPDQDRLQQRSRSIPHDLYADTHENERR